MKSVFLKRRIRAWQLYLLMLVPLIYLMVFKYYPMLGAQIAFKNYTTVKGIWGSPWVGLDNFIKFVQSYMFGRVMVNTIRISVYSLVVSFPFPIILALSLNYLKSDRYRKAVQLVTYAPHFISTVVMIGIIVQFLQTRNGLVNNLLDHMLGIRLNFLGEAGYFGSVYVWSGVWQNTGYSAIVYIAALAGVDPSLHEAATVDGATKLQRMWNIDLPCLIPTAVIMLIMNCGNILSVGFEKAFLLQNNLNQSHSEVISTYIYKVGLTSQIPQYSYAAAIDFFQAAIGLVMMLAVNQICKRLSNTSLW